MEKVIQDFYSDLFDSRAHLPTYQIPQDGYVAPSVLPSETLHASLPRKKRTAPGPDEVRPEHLKNLPPVLINTLARLFTCYLSECKVLSQWKTSNYRPICLLSVIYNLYTHVILNRIVKTLDEGQPFEQAGF